jgi:nitroreductase
MREALGEYARLGARMELLCGTDAFARARKSYGMFSGVTNLILLVEDTTDPHSQEKLGYYGELVVLRATSLGLGTCWIGGGIDNAYANLTLAANERIVCLIAIGYAPKAPRIREKFIRTATHIRKKSLADIYQSNEAPPDWFIAGVTAAHKAPSAINRLPTLFKYTGGVATASVADMSIAAMPIDLGIAKAHFAVAADGDWEWGSGGEFTKC